MWLLVLLPWHHQFIIIQSTVSKSTLPTALNHFTVKICKLIFNDGSYLQFGSSPWTSCAQIQYIVWVRYSTVELLYRASAECHRWPAVLYSTALYRTVPATTCWGRDNVCKLKRTLAIPSPATIWHWHGRRIISIIIHTQPEEG